MKRTIKKGEPIISLSRFLLSYLRHCWLFFIGSFIAALIYANIILQIPLLLTSSLKEESLVFSLSLMYMLLLLAFVSAMRYYCAAIFSERMVLFMQRDLVAKFIQSSPSFFCLRSGGEVISTLVKDSERIKTILSITVTLVLRNIIMFVGSIVKMMGINLDLALKVVGVVCLIITTLIFIAKYMGNRIFILQQHEDRAFNLISDTIKSLMVLQSFNAEKELMRRYNTQAEKTYQYTLRLLLGRICIIFLSVFALSIGISMVLMLGAHRFSIQTMSGEDLAQFAIYALMAIGSIRSSSGFFGAVLRSVDSIKQLRDFMMCQVDIPSSKSSIKIPSPSPGSVSFRNVSFVYPGASERTVLKNIDFTVQPGETAALVGLSGAGKTSILYLAMRFYDPSSGSIELDGIDIRHMSLKDVRQYITWIPQSPMIINASMHDNIAIGLPGATRAEVQQAAIDAQAHEFITCLDQGYETILGDNTVILSTGQIHRIAIARAFLRDSPILLIDEMGSALDIENESKIWKVLREKRKRRTTIFISHRFSSIQETDTVFVLRDGIICEKGTHDKLVQKSSFYSHLVGLQRSKAI
ncbi:MAG: ATP-binding cassette domain-containing protein [Candidatus Liberibacter ctenarytainae]|uniref:ATP-binding cassette domain-containing protein n=1 Tax=Candidatus Liberibacter ctenarytainae TaxID=2020335 RepID=A0A937DHC4_9HYPH|nr:ATP-binding cassette domain-containing protein [Candidatus Liberibacter ctenarytainae]